MAAPPLVHNAAIVSAERRSNASLAFRGRCCSDPSTDVVLNLSIRPETTEKEIASKLEAHLNKVARQHQAMIMAQSIAAKYHAGAGGNNEKSCCHVGDRAC